MPLKSMGGKTLIKKNKKQTHMAISPIQYLKTAGLANLFWLFYCCDPIETFADDGASPGQGRRAPH